MPLGFFLLNARFPRVLDRVDPPYAIERPFQRLLVVEITLDHVDAAVLQLTGGVTVRFARHRAELEVCPVQGTNGGAALFTRGAGDEQCAFGHASSFP